MKKEEIIPAGMRAASFTLEGNKMTIFFEPEKYVPKVGDLVKAVDSCTAIFEVSRISDGYLHLENVSITDGYINTYGDRFSITKKCKFEKLTPEEFQAEFEKLGYVYDFETHTARKKRWRAEYNKTYFFVNGASEIETVVDVKHRINDGHYKIGNYFKNEKDAEPYRDYMLQHSLKYFDK